MLSCPDCPLKMSLGKWHQSAFELTGAHQMPATFCGIPTDEALFDTTEVSTPVSVTIPMEGSKHLPDDGLSTTKRDEDLPTIQEECPSCGNDMAYVGSRAVNWRVACLATRRRT